MEERVSCQNSHHSGYRGLLTEGGLDSASLCTPALPSACSVFS